VPSLGVRVSGPSGINICVGEWYIEEKSLKKTTIPSDV